MHVRMYSLIGKFGKVRHGTRHCNPERLAQCHCFILKREDARSIDGKSGDLPV
jgi:hypothetical protein